MQIPRSGLLLLVGCLSAFLSMSCGSGSKSEAIKIEDIPTAMKAAFESSPPEIRNLADRAVAAIEAKQYPLAYNDLETLKLTPELSQKQRAVVERAMLTVAW